MVMCSVFFIDLIGRGVGRVERVHANAPLEAGCGLLTEQSLHLDFLFEVFGALVDVRETVNLVSGQVGSRGHQVLILWIVGQVIGDCHAVDGRTDDRVIDPVVDFFTEHIDSGV